MNAYIQQTLLMRACSRVTFSYYLIQDKRTTITTYLQLARSIVEIHASEKYSFHERSVDYFDQEYSGLIKIQCKNK